MRYEYLKTPFVRIVNHRYQHFMYFIIYIIKSEYAGALNAYNIQG